MQTHRFRGAAMPTIKAVGKRGAKHERADAITKVAPGRANTGKRASGRDSGKHMGKGQGRYPDSGGVRAKPSAGEGRGGANRRGKSTRTRAQLCSNLRDLEQKMVRLVATSRQLVEKYNALRRDVDELRELKDRREGEPVRRLNFDDMSQSSDTVIA